MTLPDDTRDREIIRNPGGWPMGNILPMKNFAVQEDVGPKLGCLILGRGMTRVHEVSIYEIGEAVASSKDLDALPQTEYATLDEMLLAGWRVD